MSLRIGIILKKHIDEKVLDIIRKKYNIGLIKFSNKYILRQIEESEQFFQFSKYGDDTDYGIGAYDIYTKSLNPIYNSQTLSKKEKSLFIEDIIRRRALYKKTAEELINIIKEILSINGITRMGIFYFNGYTTSDEVKVHKLEKQICNVKDLDVEYIMKIEENVLVYFQ